MNLKDQFPIVVLISLMIQFIYGKQIYRDPTLKEKFVNLAVVSNYVYIGGSQNITLLNSSLDFLHEKTMVSKEAYKYPSNWLMIQHGDVLIVCNYNSALNTLCVKYNVTNQLHENIDNELTSLVITKPGSDYFPVIVNENNRLLIASSGCIKEDTSGSTYCRSISSYKLADKINDLQFDDVKYNVVYKENSDIRVSYAAALKNGKFIYFLFGVNITHSKLGKICTDNKNARFNSYEDIPIQCNHNGKLYTAAMDAAFWSEYLFVTFSDVTTSVVCRYNLADVGRKFMEARKDRLKCPYVELNNTIFSNSNQFIGSEWCFNTKDNQCQSSKVNKNDSCPEVTDANNGFCSTQFFGSVEGQLPLVSDEVIYRGDHKDTGDIVKLAAITRETYAVIYAGTKTGKLGKIFVSQNTTIIETFTNVDKFFTILDIKINGENVYAMTENLVVNVNNEDCPTSDGCEGCMNSKNPFCGWDVLQNRCNKNNNKLFWVPSYGRKCLKLIPKDVKVNDYIESNVPEYQNVNFTVEPDVFIPIRGDVKPANCILNEVNVPVENSSRHYSCQLLFNKSGPATMTLMYDGILVVNATVNVYKCPDFKNCTKCVQGRGCYWCPKAFSCKTNADGCESAIHPYNETMCPRIYDSKSLLITENKAEDVTMYVPNFAVYNKSEHDLFKCVVGKNTYNIAANGDNVTCINVMINKKESVLSLKYNSIHQLDNYATLDVYQCQSLYDGKKCGYCKYLKSQNYKCDWCQNSCKSTLTKNNEPICSDPCIVGSGTQLKVHPPSGPVNGGTFLRIFGDNIGNPGDNVLVKINGVECTPVNVIQPSVITCTTGNSTATQTSNFSISVNGNTSYFSVQYSYEGQGYDTNINFAPDRCILSGGRKITIKGDQNYFNYANDVQFQVSFCNNMTSCINCRDVRSQGGNKITCRMDKSDKVMELTKLKVIVDRYTTIELQKSFNVVTNPTINDMSPDSAKVFRSGGSKITIKGQGFSNVEEVKMENVVTPCKKESDTSVVCETPPYVKSDYERRRRSTGQNVQVTYDNYAYLSTIYYVEDPVVYEFLNMIDYTAGSSIVITGKNLLEGATKDDYFVHIGLSGLCVVEGITSENITCQPPDAVPRTNHSDANIVYVLVQVGLLRRHVGFLKYSTQENLSVTILISVLSAVIAGTIFTISAVIFVMRRKKKIAEKNFQMELLTREENIRQASREEFADAQMTIRDIKSDLVTSRVPFFDYQTYVFNQLFPNQDINKHPLLQEPMSTDDNKHRVQEAMVMFDKLMTNKLFLKSVVQTLENQKGLSMQDKAHFACTLSVAFLGNMRLFYELVSSLLNDMIQSAPKKQHKVLFRRFDSITQRLMVNWLELSLYDHLKKQSGMQLFMLYKATQTVIEKGPIDAVTNHCRNTLAEERLLKNRVECETLTLNIDLNGNSDNHYPVTVLDCDTITQVKHKCITAIYKNKPASEIPTPNELELEWHHGRSGKLILQDKDKISDHSNGMVRLNTLKHYLVKNGSEMALMYKELLEDEPELYENQIVANAQFSSPDYVKLLIPDSLDEKNQDLHQWHLSNLTDEEKSQDYEIGELFLNRLFHTKLILRDYIDVAFEGILDPESLSVPVQYFLCMIDKQAKAVGVDSTVVQSWKSECYATRVWASLISRPQILFDVVVPSHVEPCMDILKQVFIDIFTQDAQNVSKDSSTQKLLFFKDVPEYRKHVDLFFSRVKGVSDQEFWRAIDEISSVQSREIKFNRQATLHQLYNIVAKYKDEIIEGFGANDETKDLDFGNKLEKVSEKMEE